MRWARQRVAELENLPERVATCAQLVLDRLAIEVDDGTVFRRTWNSARLTRPRSFLLKVPPVHASWRCPLRGCRWENPHAVLDILRLEA